MDKETKYERKIRKVSCKAKRRKKTHQKQKKGEAIERKQGIKNTENERREERTKEW